MTSNPLSFPTDALLLQKFLKCTHVAPAQDPHHALEQLTQAFAMLPYENLTKIIKHAQAGTPALARRVPSEVLHDHWQLGTGGTCFSLTATLLQLVRSMRFTAEPILADRPYGQDTHCALLVWLMGEPHLLDPGYLIVRPVAITQQPCTVETDFHQVILRPCARQRLELLTKSHGQQRSRLTFKLDPCDAGQFLRAWDASFDWDMMHYVLPGRNGVTAA